MWGLPQAYQNIYQEFKQLGEKPNAEGLELGLSITKRICDLLQIPLVMGSELGKGTQFTLTMACTVSSKAVQPTQRVMLNPDTELGRLRIWLLDNDKNVLDVHLSNSCKTGAAK